MYITPRGESETFANAPTGWRSALSRSGGPDLSRAHLPEALERRFGERTARQEYLERRWFEITGAPARECSFTLLVPIHNEARVLESLFASLAHITAPKQLPVRIVFVTNGCSDESPAMVRSFLERFGPVLSAGTAGLADSGLSSECSCVGFGSMELMHLDTVTASKANAMNLAAELAIQRGDRLVMSIDADAWLEPDALPTMWRDSVRALEEGAAVISGTVRATVHTNGRRSPFHRFIERRAARQWDPPEHHVSGALLAWDASWVESIGGVPRCACEDYALGLVARARGRRVVQSEAVTWVFNPATIGEQLCMHRRYVRGHAQLGELIKGDKRAEALLSRESLPTKNFWGRLGTLASWIAENPRGAPRACVKFLYWEAVRVAGRYDFKREPARENWVPCESTKFPGAIAADLPAGIGDAI